LYNSFNFSEHYNSVTNFPLKAKGFPLLNCASSRQPERRAAPESMNGITNQEGYTPHYYGMMGVKGPIPNSNPVTNFPSVGTTGADHGGFTSNGLMPPNLALNFRDVTDGLSNTFLLGEISAQTNTAVTPNWTASWRSWTQGASGALTTGAIASYPSKNVNRTIQNVSGYTSNNASRLFNDVAFCSEHVGGAHFLMGDGSVKFVSSNIDWSVYVGAVTRAQGESTSLD
jgi:hypothetical protein